MGLRLHPTVPAAEHASAVAGAQSRTHRQFERPSTAASASAPPEHARAGALRRLHVVRADERRGPHDGHQQVGPRDVDSDTADDHHLFGAGLQPPSVPRQHLHHSDLQPPPEL